MNITCTSILHENIIIRGLAKKQIRYLKPILLTANEIRITFFFLFFPNYQLHDGTSLTVKFVTTLF